LKQPSRKMCQLRAYELPEEQIGPDTGIIITEPT
jgi:hypothetical protein